MDGDIKLWQIPILLAYRIPGVTFLVRNWAGVLVGGIIGSAVTAWVLS